MSWRRLSGSAVASSTSIAVEALLHRVGRALAAPLRLVGVERLEIAADRSTLIAPFGQRRLVLVGHGGAVALCGHGAHPIDAMPDRLIWAVSGRRGAPRRLRAMARPRRPTAEAPIHRALGLTDDEADADRRGSSGARPTTSSWPCTR